MWFGVINISELIWVICTVDLILSTWKELLGDLGNGTWKMSRSEHGTQWFCIKVSYFSLPSKPDPLHPWKSPMNSNYCLHLLNSNGSLNYATIRDVAFLDSRISIFTLLDCINSSNIYWVPDLFWNAFHVLTPHNNTMRLSFSFKNISQMRKLRHTEVE